ncbi:hypothetical protein MSG28_001552 [Choristoneura fumiferana]|uniref:Uncharacterized protein n=1 Tax=Choristoneura fumiferana TaxID=7141 RepID=A0ACC0KU74_CHOFU|nr:hypothetical protein MSG28_001552 [Choristoneura fumiferana]
MEKNVQLTLKHGERVSSAYAEIYFDDNFCDKEISSGKLSTPEISGRKSTISRHLDSQDDWVSPSDLLVGIIELTPPFTSKINRGTTHAGILAIGDGVLEIERAVFEAKLKQLLRDNESAWVHLLKHEKQQVGKKLKSIYKSIFETKSNIMAKEMSLFYESSLQELEDHLRSEIQHVLISAHANIISDLNTEIQKKLKMERILLEKSLEKRFDSEVKKIRQYYHLLLENERYRNKKLINKAMHERNDALNAFYKQIQAETVTSTMYVMSLERKKCRIKQFMLDNYQTTEIKEKQQKIKDQEKVIDAYKAREHRIADINYEWECKIKKVVQLFLKFISYSLKLLPEQSTFLLDLEKMFVLQLNEIQKQPMAAPPILVEAEDIENIFSFEKAEVSKPPCDKEPFVVVGDTADPIPPRYGSRESLLPEVDLPYFRLQRQFVYAKCHKFEEVKAFLESQRCKCHDKRRSSLASTSTGSPTVGPEQAQSIETESSNERMEVDDFKRIEHCPVRNCQDWASRLTFPYLQSYLDFTEENFSRVKAILGTPPAKEITPELLNPKNIVKAKLPFSATTEPYHHAETQYSSQEDLSLVEIPECQCVDYIPMKNESHSGTGESRGNFINDMLTKRKTSLRRMLQTQPKLLKMFTDENFDFQL